MSCSFVKEAAPVGDLTAFVLWISLTPLFGVSIRTCTRSCVSGGKSLAERMVIVAVPLSAPEPPPPGEDPNADAMECAPPLRLRLCDVVGVPGIAPDGERDPAGRLSPVMDKRSGVLLLFSFNCTPLTGLSGS